jgi:hypothetical protein
VELDHTGARTPLEEPDFPQRSAGHTGVLRIRGQRLARDLLPGRLAGRAPHDAVRASTDEFVELKSTDFHQFAMEKKKKKKKTPHPKKNKKKKKKKKKTKKKQTRGGYE